MWFLTLLCLLYLAPVGAAAPALDLSAPYVLQTEGEQSPELWRHVRVWLGDRSGQTSPGQAADALSADHALAMRHRDDDFGRQRWPAWASLSITNPRGQSSRLVLSTWQTTLEVFQLFRFQNGQWVPVPGRHELAQHSFERDRAPSFDLELAPGETTRLLMRTETAAPIKYLLQIRSPGNHSAENTVQHFWIILAYAVPLVLVVFITLLRYLEGAGIDWLFASLVFSDILASAWLVGLLPQMFPLVSGWTYRWLGQLAYAGLQFFLCWHAREFLNLRTTVPLGDKIVRATGWIALLSIIALMFADLRLGARLTMPILLVATIVCLITTRLAVRRKVPYARTYAIAIIVYLLSSLAYVLYYLGFAPMTLFGALAFVQTAGICVVMSIAVAGALVSKDLKLQRALTEADRQKTEVQLLVKERDRLFAAANHDLRQPLQAVALNLELLRQLNLSAEQQAISARMKLALSSMSNMLSSFLDLRRASLNVTALSAEPVALGPILDSLGMEYREHARAKGLSLKTVASSVWVRGDALLIERAVRNLISNALRYTDQGRVLIGVRRGQGRVRIVVIDSGRGMSPEQKSRLFTEGTQPPATVADQQKRKGRRASAEQQQLTPELSSYGMGLFIVKSICDRLQAQILVDSKPGEGSSFQIVLEQCAAPEATAFMVAPGMPPLPSPQTSAGPLQGRRVLVVDDDKEILILLDKFLRSWSARAVLDTTAEAALARFDDRPVFDAVLCDLDLGSTFNGLDVLIKAGRACPGATLILMSGRSRDDVFGGSDQQGVHWLAKPLDAGQLLGLLQG